MLTKMFIVALSLKTETLETQREKGLKYDAEFCSKVAALTPRRAVGWKKQTAEQYMN